MLTAAKIISEVQAGRIVIDPFNLEQLNPNSYNVKLGDFIKVYNYIPLDTRAENRTTDMRIPPEGIVLEPGVLYLGTTQELTHTPHHIPQIGGRSSTARLGITVHQTGGFGDIGFKGRWTLEIVVVHRTRVYAGDEIAQIWFAIPDGDISFDYAATGRYQGQMEPVPSLMHLPKKVVL